GGFTIEAVEEVCSDDHTDDSDIPENASAEAVVIESWEVLDMLTSLIDKSLVAMTDVGERGTRYRLLETVRQYAAEKLAVSRTGTAVQRRHRDYFLRL